MMSALSTYCGRLYQCFVGMSRDVRADAGVRRQHVRGNAALDSVPTDVSQRVRLVNGLVLYRFGGNAGKLGPTSDSRDSGTCASRNARRSV
jgi:hypothetical protein